jgi:MFS family permease
VSARVPLPRDFWVVFAGTLVNRAGTFVEPFLVLYLTTQRGFSAAGAGLVLAVYGAGAALSQLVGGWSSDHLGRRTTLAWGMLASAVALAGLGAARGGAAIAATAFVVGLAGDIYRPASQALVADLLPPEQRARAFGLLFWAVNLGFSLAAVTAGFLAAHGYWLLFAIDSATCAAYAVVVLVGIRRDPPRAVHDDADGSPAPGFGTALRDRTFMILVACTVLQAVAYFQVYLVLPLAVTDASLPTSAYGVIAAANGVVIVLFQPLAVRLTSGWDPSRTLAGSLLLMGIGLWLTTFVSSLAGFLLTVVVWTVGEIGTSGHLPAIVSDLAPATARGRYMGLFGFSFGLAGLLAPLLGPPLYQALGGAWVWATCLALLSLSALGNLAIRSTVLGRRAEHALVGAT